jgi:hypothetical protein
MTEKEIKEQIEKFIGDGDLHHYGFDGKVIIDYNSIDTEFLSINFKDDINSGSVNFKEIDDPYSSLKIMIDRVFID